MHVQFIIIVTLLFVSIYMLLKKKLNIKEQTCLYGHINKIHKRGELLIVVVSLLLLGILAFVETTPPLKSYYFVASLTALYGFRALMEWKYEKASKRYILSIIASSFLLIIFLGMELIFTNPVPVKLDVDQVNEISVLLESGQEEIILTNNPKVYPILSALSDATYQMGRWPVTPSTEMTIKLKDGRKVIIGEYKTKTLSGSTSTAFIVNAERKLYPQDMMMYSPELEFILDHLDLGDPDITGSLERNPDREGMPAGIRCNDDQWHIIDLCDDAKVIDARGEEEIILPHSEVYNLAVKAKLIQVIYSVEVDKVIDGFPGY